MTYYGLQTLALHKNGAVVLGHGKPLFRCEGAAPNMYSMRPHMQNIVPPPRMLL
jgi:hypothetical protein